MFVYKISLLSVSKNSLSNAVYSLQSALDMHYKYTRYMRKKWKYVPLIEVGSTSYRRISRAPVKKKRFSVIRSPFVFKKSGETFLFKHYQASFVLKLNSSKTLTNYSIRCLFRYLLKNQNPALVFKGVELRVVCFETI